jgi:hypothetical protein
MFNQGITIIVKSKVLVVLFVCLFLLAIRIKYIL